MKVRVELPARWVGIGLKSSMQWMWGLWDRRFRGRFSGVAMMVMGANIMLIIIYDEWSERYVAS